MKLVLFLTLFLSSSFGNAQSDYVFEIKMLKKEPRPSSTNIDFEVTNRTRHMMRSWQIYVKVFNSKKEYQGKYGIFGSNLKSQQSAVATGYFNDIRINDIAYFEFEVETARAENTEGFTKNIEKELQIKQTK
jgi:hypothetical protein